MATLPLLLAALPTVAGAFPGTLAAPDGAAPAVDTTYVMLARQGEETTLTVAPRLTGSASRLGLVIPIPAVVDPRLDAEVVPPPYLERVEAFGAPRINVYTCDELVTDTYYSTPPGCTSYEPEVQEEARGEDATGGLSIRGLGGAWTAGAWELAVVTVDTADGGVDGLADWLTAEGLAVSPASEAVLADHAAAGDAFLVATVALDDPADGRFLEPLQVRYPDPDFVLPVRLGAVGATGPQELVITAVTEADAGGVVVDNYPRAVVENECLLDPADLAAWYDDALDEALATEPLPGWLLEYSGSPARCAPCLGDPLEAYELLDFGYDGAPDGAWLTRLRMRWAPGTLDQDLQLSLQPPPETRIRFVEHRREIEFAFPSCGAGYPQDPGVCEALNLPRSGCSTGAPPAGAGRWAAGLLLALALVARRRGAALVLLGALGLSAPARAEPPAFPRYELSGSTTVLSTDRVRFEDRERGGPHLLMPMLGVDGRVPLLIARGSGSGSGSLADGRLGLAGGIRGFVGNATPGSPNLPVSFLFLEPHAGFDIRWGGAGRRAVAPTARAGAQLALGILDSSVYRPRATLGGLFHVGGGLFVGDGDRPLVVELQGSVIPRTDGWGTSFHPGVRLPGWLYFPGSANLSLHLGVGFR